MTRRGKTGTTGRSGTDDLDTAGTACSPETHEHATDRDDPDVRRPSATEWHAAMDELIHLVETHRRLDDASIARVARRLGVSVRTVHDRYREAIRPLVARGAALSLADQEAIAAAPDRRTAIVVLQRRGRDESAVLLLEAIARCPGRLLLELRRRDPVGAEAGGHKSSDEPLLQRAFHHGLEA